MKNIFYTFVTIAFLIGCEDDTVDYLEGKAGDQLTPPPTELSNIKTIPIEGGATIHWDIPSDSNFTYVEVLYDKNKEEFVELSSKFTDSIVIDGLINKDPKSFSLRTVITSDGKKYYSNSFETEQITPIKREPTITYFPDELEQLNISPDMLETYTQEPSEGPKENLVDGDPNTYWHSAWSSGEEPLPHHIQVTFEEPQEVGVIKYYLRNPSGASGRPRQMGLSISEDGNDWESVWKSEDSLDIDDLEVEHSLVLDKNYESRYFRVMFYKAEDDTNYVHLGEVSLHKMESRVVDKEKEAEEEYYSDSDTLQ